MFKEGQLLITFYEHTNAQTKSEIHTQLGGKKIDEIPKFHMDLIEVPAGEEETFQALYKNNLHVRFVDFHIIYTIGSCKKHRFSKYGCCHYEMNQDIKNDCILNDYYYFQKFKNLTNQWGLQRIHPTEAYCVAKYKPLRTKIAILDTGIDPTHPDLIGKIIDPINVASDDPTDYMDRAGHGTFVAGIAAATTDNQIGMASASYNTAYIVPIKIRNENAEGVLAIDVIKGIVYAIEKKVDVINMSFFTDDPRGYLEALQLVIKAAWKQNIILVAGVGNDGTTAPFYPAANNFVLGVSATDPANQLSVVTTQPPFGVFFKFY
ncbi:MULTISPECIES: S8 family peptidase [Bacillus]|uniref:Peptidase S8/S53 domain-containing protein n=1 Tax=Bacillus cereus TaxID=1396 RepID=A0A9X6GBY0_BACCE|nr:S8 family serine peptidase [Bacillus cereus]OOR70873.1 hypothetical protein BLX06_34025 [Bacillus cereus]